MRLLDYGASSKERAKALLREIRSMQVCLTCVCSHCAPSPGLFLYLSLCQRTQQDE